MVTVSRSLSVYSEASEWGVAPAVLARLLVRQIRLTFDDPIPLGRDVRTGPRPRAERAEQQRAEAARHRLEGDAAFTRGDLRMAQDAYRAACRADPSYITAYARLGGLYLDTHRSALARQVLDEGLQWAPQDPELRELHRRSQ